MRCSIIICAACLFCGGLYVSHSCAAQVTLSKASADDLVELVDAVWIPATADGLPDEAKAKVVRLPQSLQSNAQLRNRTWYRIRFLHDPKSGGRQAIYFRGLFAHLSLTLNDHFLGTTGSLSDAPPRSWNQMRLFEIPMEFLREGENHLLIEAGGHGAWAFSPPLIGPPEAARRQYVGRVITTAIAPYGVGVIVAFLGAFAIMLWAYGRREPLYAYYGFANLLCGLHTVWLMQPVLPLPPALNRISWVATFMLWVSIFLIFFVRFTGERWRRFEGALWVFGIGSFPVLYLANESGRFSEVSLAWRALGLVIVATALVIIARFAWKRKRADGALLFATGLLALGFGIHDWWTGQTLVGLYSRVPLVPYIGIAFVLLFGWLLATRFNSDVDTLENVNESLAERVAEKTRELADNFDRLRATEREQSTLEERSRILRDMHDGLGTKLMISLRSLERGEIDNQSAAAMIRDCIDELRLTVDAYDQTDGDLAGLLANLRYRLGDRLVAAGLAVEWRVTETPRIPSLEKRGRELMRIIQEALNNILKHADATHVVFATSREGDRVRVSLKDNGRGFLQSSQLELQPGHGLNNMRLRAEQLGGHLSISCDTNGTEISVLLPLNP